MERARELAGMLGALAPRLAPGLHVFCTTAEAARAAEAAPAACASFREEEGLSLILPLEDAGRLGFAADLPMRRITLGVTSALDAVGLTAAVAGALAEAGIACNVVAAFHHDHLFVPAERAEEALSRLRALARQAQGADG